MDIVVTSYNMHGYNQGKNFLPSLTDKSDVVFIQEHWLYPEELGLIGNCDDNFESFCTSAMPLSMHCGIRRGRPFGGVGMLIRKALLSNVKIVAKRDRFIAALITDVLFVNVYFPCVNGMSDYVESMQCMLSDLENVIANSGVSNIVIGGDFNFDFSNDGVGCRMFSQLMCNFSLSLCDSFIDLMGCINEPVTYFQLGSGNSSFIDHFCVSKSLLNNIVKSFIIDSGENLSDHLPLCLVLTVDSANMSYTALTSIGRKRLRWDKADLISYYYGTYDCLSHVKIRNDLLRCNIGCNCDVQSEIDSIYSSITNALTVNSDRFVPKTASGFYKHWWNDTLSDLKCASIAAHNMWKASNCPRSGDLFMQMKRAKVAYKNAIKAHRIRDESYFSDDLHELLLQKDMVSFWKTWNAKLVKPKYSSVIDGETEGHKIAYRFADRFRENCTMNANKSHESVTDIYEYIATANSNDFTLLDVETVSMCLSQMKLGKAPGVDAIEAEHLLNAHPLIVILLCSLFNILLTHGTVPHLFSCGVIIPVLKDSNGDITDITNYRAITVSPCISKLFEMCILQKFDHLFTVSPLQFGFQKKLSCSHAIFALRSITDYYTTGLSTVNIAFLDMSSAFDKVVHNVLFRKLIKLRVPPTVLKLLFLWYMNSNVYVRWGAYTSYIFMLSAGVRQGGVLSPILFCIYVDCIVQSLELSKLGCWIGEMFVGCIMYADDLALISSSVCELQRMLDMCADILAEIGMQINSNKCSILRFGPQYANSCATVWFQDSPVAVCDKAKYLGIQLQSGKVFSVDLSHCKAKFYRAFNGVFHRAAKLRNEITTLHLVSSYCKPYLLYAMDCVALSVTQMRSLHHTWQCAVSHVFNVCGSDVNFISSRTDNCSLDAVIVSRSKRFLHNLCKLHYGHPVLYQLYLLFGQSELHRLNALSGQ